MYFYNQKVSTTKMCVLSLDHKIPSNDIVGVHFTVKAYHSTLSPVSLL